MTTPQLRIGLMSAQPSPDEIDSATPGGENYAAQEDTQPKTGLMARLTSWGRRIARSSPAPQPTTATQGEGGVNVMIHSTPSRNNSRRPSLSPIPATQSRHTSPRSHSQTTMGDTPGFGEDLERRENIC